MAERTYSDVVKGLPESESNDATSKAGSSAEPQERNASFESTTSCPATLEPTEYDPLFEREQIRRPFKTYRAIMRSFNSREIYADSDEPSNDGENGQMCACSLASIYLFNRYKTLAVKFRNSKLIYVVQILLTLLPLSAILMGFKYVDDCPGAPNLSFFNGLTALVALFLIAFWMCITYCRPEDRPCEGLQKFYILLLFLFVSALLELEIYFFNKLSPTFYPSTTNYCSKVFYDYIYYKFIAAFGSILFVVLIYFPDYSSLASGVSCDPIAGRCYEVYLEENE